MKHFRKLSVLWVLMLVIAAFACTSFTAYAEESSVAESSVTSSAQDKTEKPKKERNIVKSVAISLGIGIVGTGIIVFLIYRGYKTNGQTEPYLYTKKAPLDLSVSTDTLVNTVLDKKKIEKNQS